VHSVGALCERRRDRARIPFVRSEIWDPGHVRSGPDAPASFAAIALPAEENSPMRTPHATDRRPFYGREFHSAWLGVAESEKSQIGRDWRARRDPNFCSRFVAKILSGDFLFDLNPSLDSLAERTPENGFSGCSVESRRPPITFDGPSHAARSWTCSTARPPAVLRKS
jgi:hypothetical protein